MHLSLGIQNTEKQSDWRLVMACQRENTMQDKISLFDDIFENVIKLVFLNAEFT